MRKVIAILAMGLFMTSLFSMFVPSTEVEADLKSEIAVSSIIYTFSVASDGHIGETLPAGDNWNGERNQILADSVLYQGSQRHFETGDILDESTEYALYPTVKAIYDGMGIPYHLVIGNHDAPAYFLSTFGYDSLYYNVTYGDFVWLMMNSSEHYLPAAPVEMNATQLQYIDDALNYYSDKLVFIMMHINHIKLSYPVIEIDSPTFQASVEAHADHIGGVFVGHSHNWQAITYEINSVRYSNAGTYGNDYAMGGVSYYPYRYLMVDVYDDWSIEIEGINPDTNEQTYGSTASYTPDIGDSPVWNGAGAEPRLASNAGNWLNGIPAAGKTTIFDNTSVLNCTWDIDVGNSMYLRPGWTGYINQSVETSFDNFLLWEGWYVPDIDYRTTISGNAIAQGIQNTRITNEVFRVELTGDYKKYAFPYLTPILDEIIISGNVQQTGRQYVGTGGKGMNVTGTLYINPGIRFTLYPYADSIFSGTITGPGEFVFDASLYGTGPLPAITGSIECDYIFVQSENSRTWELERDLTLGGELIIQKTVGGGMNNFDTQGYDLNIGGLYTSGNVTLFANGTDVICNGGWNTYNSTYYVDGDIAFTGDDCFVAFGYERMPDNLELYGTRVTFFMDRSLFIAIPDYERVLGFYLYYNTTIHIILPVVSTDILTYEVNSTDGVNVVTAQISGLSEISDYQVYEDDVLYTDQVRFSGSVLEIISTGNHTYRITLPTGDYEFTDETFQDWISAGGFFMIFGLMGAIGLIAGAPLAIIFYKSGRSDGARALAMAVGIIFVSLCFLLAGLSAWA